MAATAQQLATLVQGPQAAEAAALEQQASAAAVGGADAAMAALLTAAITGWVTVFGALTAAGAGVVLAEYLASVRQKAEQTVGALEYRAPRVIERSLNGAVEMGARHALDFAVRAGGPRLGVSEVSVPKEALAAARDVAAVVHEQARLAARLLSPGSVSSWRDVLVGIGAARRAVTLVRQSTAWAVHRAVNAGSQQATVELEAKGLWVAEPTACVRCAAYSGHLSDRDGRFPGGLSLDPHQRNSRTAALDGPPLHPACRCRLVPWRTEWARPGRTALPDLLREQAWRSAATGGGRPTESRAARLRAARYVSTQTGVPAGVRRQAHAAVAAGHF